MHCGICKMELLVRASLFRRGNGCEGGGTSIITYEIAKEHKDDTLRNENIKLLISDVK